MNQERFNTLGTQLNQVKLRLAVLREAIYGFGPETKDQEQSLTPSGSIAILNKIEEVVREIFTEVEALENALIAPAITTDGAVSSSDYRGERASANIR